MKFQASSSESTDSLAITVHGNFASNSTHEDAERRVSRRGLVRGTRARDYPTIGGPEAVGATAAEVTGGKVQKAGVIQHQILTLPQHNVTQLYDHI